MITTADILSASILIVDDQAANVILLEEMLRGAGYTNITTTQNPRDVCTLHRLNRYDLILLDLQMPGLDGFQVMEGLKEIEAGGYLPVLVITAQPDHKLRALKSGAKDFVSKPFELPEVLLRVHNLLEVRLLHRKLAQLNLGRLENSQLIAGLGDWEYDPVDRRLVWSEGVYRILGLVRQDAPPSIELFERLVHPDDLARYRQQNLDAQAADHRVEFVHRIIRPDGEVRHFQQITEMKRTAGDRPATQTGVMQDITRQKLAEVALRASEHRFRALSESAPLGIFECAADGSVVHFNPALIELTGRPAADSLGRPWVECLHPEDREFTAAGWARAATEGRSWSQEVRLLRPDGTERWVHTIAATNRDAAGGLAGFVGTVEDITERQLAEAALLESEERFRKLLMLSPDGHFVQVDGLVTFANQVFCALLGAAAAAQLLGRPALELVHPDDRAAMRERSAQHPDDRPLPPAEMKFVRLDGTAVPVEVASTAFDHHGRREVQVVARDITARLQAVAALRASEERFKFVARAVSDVVWDWDLATNTLWWNDGFLTTFGYAAGEIAPSVAAWTGRIHPGDRTRVVDGIQFALAGPAETWGAEYRIQRKDGSHVFVQDRGFILRDAAGQALRMVGGMRDLTEQKKMETQYLRAQRMESIGTLAGGIAHDLNNVFTPIMLSIELLKRDAGDDPRRSKVLNVIQGSSQRGSELVRQVLSFARGLDGRRVAIRLLPLIKDLEEVIAAIFPRNIHIVVETPPDLWPIMGDPTQLHQVLLNLAVNARDAMLRGGTLTLRAANITIDAQFAGTSQSSPNGSSQEAKAGPYVLLQVTDTGVGMPPEVRERIFEPFFTTKELGKGTGIGLATVHTVVKSHGGFLSVESAINEGTTFRIYLPADPALKTTQSEPPLPAVLPHGFDELVLVVDDEMSIREITQQTLEAFNYRVITANDGAEAVALYARQAAQIAVVLTDMMMPIMDGAATIQVLRRINPAIRLIATSGIDSGKNVAKAISAGVHDFLPKPYTAETLLTLLRKVLDRPAVPELRSAPK